MDADRFDAVLRTLAETPTRRCLARMLAGLAVAGPIAARTSPIVEAKRHHKKHKKTRKGCNPITCASGQRCVGGTCVCDATSCATGCCAGTTCHVDDDAACGTSGGGCTACTGTTPTCGGGNPPTPGVCGCIPAGSPCNVLNAAQCCSLSCTGPIGGPFACQ